MIKPEIKRLISILQAYLEGKTIQYKKRGTDQWFDNKELGLAIYEYNDYRVKPESKYRPFKSKEECWNEMLKHQPFGWVKEISTEMLYLINGMTNTSIVTMENINSFEEAINIYKFKDGEPFGIKED